MLVLLFPVLITVGQVIARPSRVKRDTLIIHEETEETIITSTTPPTFQVERLDAPIERIEIRLIDDQESDNNTGVYNDGFPQVTASETARFEEHVDDDPQMEMPQEYHKYKKVEYDVDGIPPSPTPLVVTMDGEQVVGQPNPVDPDAFDRKPWAPMVNKEMVDDVIELPPDVEAEENPDDEGEPVEECLLNKDQLPHDVVERLQAMKHKLGKMIRRLNKQQSQYCTEVPDYEVAPIHEKEYRQCPTWREEKMVHYYKLMRIMYCQDMSRWPNASRVKRQFEPKIHLFETMYAFQKSETA